MLDVVASWLGVPPTPVPTGGCVTGFSGGFRHRGGRSWPTPAVIPVPTATCASAKFEAPGACDRCQRWAGTPSPFSRARPANGVIAEDTVTVMNPWRSCPPLPSEGMVVHASCIALASHRTVLVLGVIVICKCPSLDGVFRSFGGVSGRFGPVSLPYSPKALIVDDILVQTLQSFRRSSSFSC